MAQYHTQWQLLVLVMLSFGFYYQMSSCLVTNHVHIPYKVVHVMCVIYA
jgi:hypothetical protein